MMFLCWYSWWKCARTNQFYKNVCQRASKTCMPLLFVSINVVCEERSAISFVESYVTAIHQIG